MKQPILILISLAFFQFSFGQEKSFEGIIKYRTITTSYVDTIVKDVDTSYSSIYHKNGNHVIVQLNSNGKQIFIRANCRTYVLAAYSNDVQVFDRTNQEPILEIDSLISKKELLGYRCKGMRIKTKSGVQTGYFSPVHSINASGLKSCGIEYLSNKIPLYTLLEEPGSYKMEIIAFDIVSEPVDDSLFELPKNVKNIDVIKD
ncbi:MAG: hypothetical protein ACO1N0_10675 [Fluviicola sp.]